MELLPRAALIRTSKVDRADWNFRPLLGVLQRTRFRLVCDLLRGRRYSRLLEVGYGSGVFMPELRRHCDEIYGLDVHDKQDEVAEVLSHHGLAASLHSGSVTAMPFASAWFDCIVAVSALEYVDDMEAACREMRRVMRPGGTLVVVTPGESRLLDFGLKLLTGEDAWDNYADRRRRLIPTLQRHFACETRTISPRWVGTLVPMYNALRLRVPDQAPKSASP